MTPAPWQRAILEHGELYRVGGSVRDTLLGRVPGGDDDFVVRGMAAAAFEALMRPFGKLTFVGRAFGVYKFIPAEGPRCDLAFPRTERSTGPGHTDFDVQWDPALPLEADLQRRDFTINAIAEDVRDGAIIDPCGGRADLQRKTLRMIFPAAFDEDPLRILRGVRFAARLGFAIDPDTLAAMGRAAAALCTLSAERVQIEWSLLLTQGSPVRGSMERLHQLGALAILFPELDRAAGVTQNEYHPDDVFVHTLKTVDGARNDLRVRWACLLHDLGKVEARRVVDGRVVFYGHETISAEIAQTVLERYRYPTEFVARCRGLVAEHMFRYAPEWKDATVRRFIRRVGVENLDGLFALREADCHSRDLDGELQLLEELRRRVRAQLSADAVLDRKDLAIDGDIVMRECNIRGIAVGRVLEELLQRVLEDPSRNHAGVLTMMAKEIVRELHRAEG